MYFDTFDFLTLQIINLQDTHVQIVGVCIELELT